MSKLNAGRVQEIFKDSLAESGVYAKQVSGIAFDAYLLLSKIDEYRNEIFDMLLELDDKFMRSKGGGASFLESCYDKYGTQWGEQDTMMLLFMLGIGAGKVVETLPRSLWDALPGNVPYYTVLDEDHT